MSREKKLLIIELAILILILAGGTLVFRVTDLDMQIQRAFYSAEEGWFLNSNIFVQLIYRHSNIPALIISVASLFVFAISFSKKKMVIYRKLSLYLLLAMLIGPGIIVNSVFKENWGRPRPRSVSEFGGRRDYLQVIDRGIRGAGKSFPCGHASMGFYFFTFYFIFRKKRKKLAYSFFAFALLSGLIIGLVRIVQGGHFASDVLWSGGMNYLSSLLLFYVLGMHKSVYWKKGSEVRFSKPLTIGLLLLTPLVVYFLLLSTPYYANRLVEIDLEDTKFHRVRLLFDVGEVEAIPADSLYFHYEAIGFRFPGAKLILEQNIYTSNDTTYYDVRLKKRGSFNELNNSVLLYLVDSDDIQYQVEIKKGELTGIHDLPYPLIRQLKNQ